MEQSSLLDVGLNEGTYVLSHEVKDSIPNAKRQYQEVHEYWTNKDFVPLFFELSKYVNKGTRVLFQNKGTRVLSKEQSAILDVCVNEGTIVLSHEVIDTIPQLSGVATSFLEAVGVIDAEKHFGVIDPERHWIANAEKHFQAVHELWMNKDFVSLLFEVSYCAYPYLLGLTMSYANWISDDLQQSRIHFIRKDPSLKDILFETDPSVRLRGAISILIRYWCMENMLEEYFFRNIGLIALGLDISFAAAAAEETPLNSEGEKEMFFGLPEKRVAGSTALAPESSKRSRPITMPLNWFSPIGQLVNVPSIQRLAQDVKRYPKLVEVAEQLLSTLEDDHFKDEDKPRFGRKEPFVIHCEVMWDFWRDQDFCVLMREHLLKDPHLFVMVKMFSNRFKREITMDRLQHIHTTLLPKLEKTLEFGDVDLKDPVDRIRCAFSIMMCYWACAGVALRLREKLGYGTLVRDGRPVIKYHVDFKDEKDEQIGEALYYQVHNDEPADCDLTRWYEANETEINYLLDKEWRDVLTCRNSIDEAEIKGLLGKIDFDKRMNMVLKRDCDGKLCMTCTELTPVACTI